MSVHREVERKFDLGPDQSLPDLVGGTVAAVGEPSTIELAATYFDTASLALAAARITLRRRTGGDDAGWHLKLPGGDGARTEIRHPLGRSTRTPPAQLLDRVRAVVRDQRLAPVAVLTTVRVERRLLGPDGTDLAVLVDDTVEGTRLTGGDGGSGSTTWRELEVELVDGDDAVLDDVSELLHRAGITLSSAPSKVARVLAVERQPVALARTSVAPGSAGALLQQRLREQVDQLLAQDHGARTGDEDAVHDFRVAARRLRSLLATYRPVLDRAVTEPLRDELRWLGGEVGAARVAQVQRERLTARLAAVSRDLVLGPVRRRAGLVLQAQTRAALDRMRSALSSDRYYRLLDALGALVADPPLVGRAARPRTDVVPRLVGRQVRRVRRAAAAAAVATDGAEREAVLHEVRKAAKRARYAAEAAVAVAGKPARRLASRMEDVQDLLGEHQDAVTARALHRELGVAAYAAGENGFTFGLLRAEEDAVARAVQARYPDVLRRATRKKVTRWTR